MAANRGLSSRPSSEASSTTGLRYGGSVAGQSPIESGGDGVFPLTAASRAMCARFSLSYTRMAVNGSDAPAIHRSRRDGLPTITLESPPTDHIGSARGYSLGPRPFRPIC